MVLRPSARSSSWILAYASRKWLAGTTSLRAWTAVVAPASANRFQLQMTLGEISSSRLARWRFLPRQDSLHRRSLELPAERPSAVCLPPVFPHGRVKPDALTQQHTRRRDAPH